MNCEECGSSDNEFNEQMGERICSNCGLVLVTEMFEETVHIISRETSEIVRSSDKGKLGSVITGKGSSKYNKFGRNSVIPPYIQQGLSHCNMVLSSVAPNMSLKERVEKIYMELFNKHIFGKTTYEVRATAIVYYALKENGTPHSLSSVCSEFDLPRKKVNKLIRKINQFYRNATLIKPIDAQYLLEQTLVSFNVDMEFRKQCIDVLEFFETQVAKATFNKGRSYYACIIWIASNIFLNREVTQDLILEKTGFSRWIIWRQTQAILSLIGYQNAAELKGIDLNKIGE